VQFSEHNLFKDFIKDQERENCREVTFTGTWVYPPVKKMNTQRAWCYHSGTSPSEMSRVGLPQRFTAIQLQVPIWPSPKNQLSTSATKLQLAHTETEKRQKQSDSLPPFKHTDTPRKKHLLRDLTIFNTWILVSYF